MTAYASSTTETLTTSDALTRGHFAGLAAQTENLGTSDLPTNVTSTPRSPTETLTTTDTVSRRTQAKRFILDGYIPIPIGSGLPLLLSAGGGITDRVTAQSTHVRPITEALVTADAPVVTFSHVVPTISETTSISDVVSRVVGNYLTTSEFLTTMDTVTRRTSWSRRTSDLTTGSTSDVILVFHSRVFALTERLTITDAVVRAAHFIRNPIELYTGIGVGAIGSTLPLLLGGPPGVSRDTTTYSRGHLRGLAESLTTSDSSVRHWVARRYPAETLITGDVVRRGITVHRTLSDSVTTNPVMTWLHSSPRHFFENLTTSDSITNLIKLMPIMGYIYYNPTTQTAIANLPDWGFILTEDPVAGVSMNFAPVESIPTNPMRTK